MYKVDVSEIAAKMAKKGLTQREVAQALKISTPTLRKYLCDPDKMPYGVIVALIEVLGIGEADAGGIFFAR